VAVVWVAELDAFIIAWQGAGDIPGVIEVIWAQNIAVIGSRIKVLSF